MAAVTGNNISHDNIIITYYNVVVSAEPSILSSLLTAVASLGNRTN